MSISQYAILPWDASSPHLDSILALARDTWPTAGEPSLPRHMRYPDFLGRLALDAEGRMAGYVYGTTALAGQWWTEHIAEVLGAEETRRQVVGSFAVTELAILPERRRQGIGQILMRALLAAALSAPSATLSTEYANIPARAVRAPGLHLPHRAHALRPQRRGLCGDASPLAATIGVRARERPNRPERHARHDGSICHECHERARRAG